VPRTEPVKYLGDVVEIGRRFSANYEATTKHMATPRPGEGGFPGGTPDQWKQYLQADYKELLPWKTVAPGRIGDARLGDLLTRLDTEYGLLVTRKSDYAYLLDPAQPKPPAWSKAASTLGGMLVDLTKYADLPVFNASDDGKLVATLEGMPSWDDKPKRLDEWRIRQQTVEKAILTRGSDLATATPDPRMQWTERRPVVEAAAQLALLWRMLPIAGQFFSESLVTKCPPGNCYQPAFARSMIPSASGIVSAASAERAAATFDGVPAAIKGVADSEATYLRRYIDQMAGRAGGGGAGFVVPASASAATSWPGFQKAIGSWQPQGGGGGAVAADASGQLTATDFQQFANANQYLAEVYEEYRSRIERPRAAAAGSSVAPELIEAANAFRAAVTGVSDQPLQAWRQLARGEGGTLKQYKAFSDGPRLKSNPTAMRMKREVEDHGAHLIRDAIRPQFAQREPAAWAKISSCCLGKFPFINEIELEMERQKFANATAYSRAGAAGAATYRIDLPTIGVPDITGAIAEMGSLAADFALEPIFAGDAPEFDFVGEHRSILGIASTWERFLFGPPSAPGQAAGPPRDHRIEIRSIERPPTLGTVFVGDRVGQVTLFDKGTILRPSTDVKTGRTPPPYVWRLAAADSLLSVIGKNEDQRGWTGTLEVTGGPLKLFYYIRCASEDRRPNQDDHVWDIRVEIPDAEKPNGRLQGVFELKLDDALPGVLPR
jgi:hypothetical protein